MRRRACRRRTLKRRARCRRWLPRRSNSCQPWATSTSRTSCGGRARCSESISRERNRATSTTRFSAPSKSSLRTWGSTVKDCTSGRPAAWPPISVWVTRRSFGVCFRIRRACPSSDERTCTGSGSAKSRTATTAITTSRMWLSMSWPGSYPSRCASTNRSTPRTTSVRGPIPPSCQLSSTRAPTTSSGLLIQTMLTSPPESPGVPSGRQYRTVRSGDWMDCSTRRSVCCWRESVRWKRTSERPAATGPSSGNTFSVGSRSSVKGSAG
ncbi:hypothetical protein C5N14_29300 [Micromonospora sp. MW-13]|nr:hypothetical protein C5N14_29300 [Micromonospora sp. MW-13]